MPDIAIQHRDSDPWNIPSSDVLVAYISRHTFDSLGAAVTCLIEEQSALRHEPVEWGGCPGSPFEAHSLSANIHDNVQCSY